MDETELLRTLRPILLQRTTLALAKGAGLREDVRKQLENFFDLLEQALETGDPAWLDSILSLWSTSMTQTDLESGQSNLSRFIKEIMLLTYQVCRETLGCEQALDLTSALVPGFAYAFEKAAYYEMQARVAYVSNQLKQVQLTLERLDRSKSDFIAVAAHELKTPLTLIEGYTAMLRDSRRHEDQPPAEIEMLDGINAGARRLKTIIDDMIDVSLIDNNLMQLNFQPIWVNRLLAVIQSELEPAARERKQVFDMHNFEGSGEMTFGDPERLLQVFRHVLSNAVKFTPDGGCITINASQMMS